MTAKPPIFWVFNASIIFLLFTLNNSIIRGAWLPIRSKYFYARNSSLQPCKFYMVIILVIIGLESEITWGANSLA